METVMPEVDNSMDYMLGIDIGGTNFRIGAVRKNNEFASFPLKISVNALFNDNSPLDTIVHEIECYRSQIPSGNMKGIGIGFPGTVNKEKTGVISCPNVPALQNINISKPLSDRFHVPVVALHDVIPLMTADMKALHINSQEVSCVIACYLGTGVGNGIFIHGHFLDGKNGVAGELGHIPVWSKKDRCPCGNNGCIELYAGGKQLERIHDAVCPSFPLSEIFTRYSEYPLLSEYIEFIATAIGTEVNILDPDYIILSGGVINMKDFPFDDLCKRIRAIARKPYPAQNLSFLRGVKDPYNGVRGAGLYLWNQSAGVIK